jgi:hypothetical protein
LDIIYRHKLKTEFKTFAGVSRLLMQTGFTFTKDIRTDVHTRRILMTGNNANPADISTLVHKALDKAYYFARLPRWAWQNVFYGDEGTSNWKRIGSLAGGLFKERFRENIRA